MTDSCCCCPWTAGNREAYNRPPYLRGLCGNVSGTWQKAKAIGLRSDDSDCGGENSLCVAWVTHRLGDLDHETWLTHLTTHWRACLKGIFDRGRGCTLHDVRKGGSSDSLTAGGVVPCNYCLGERDWRNEEVKNDRVKLLGDYWVKTRSLSDRLRTRTYVQTNTSRLVVTVMRQTRRPTYWRRMKWKAVWFYLNLLSVAVLKEK